MLGNYKQSTLTPVTINVQKQQMTKVEAEAQAEGEVESAVAQLICLRCL